MSFSKHVGLEPASDLKTRIMTLCQEAGFEVMGAEMHLIRKETMQDSGRIIHVWAREPGWTRTVPDALLGTDWEKQANNQMEIRATIGADGTFSGAVQVLCSATDVAAAMPLTLRTNEVQLMDLPPFLVEVAKQQRQIILARKKGENGPWRFGAMSWEEFQP
jgi:hypothetical protein